jgi:hypothetical protein
MGQFSVEKPGLPGSVLSGNQQFYALYVSSGPRLVRSPIHGGLEPGKTLPCMIVGHNLPFDLGRLTYSYGYARDKMFGGLTYKLLKHRPDIAVKKLGFAKVMNKPHTDKNDRSNHIFVDTQQLGRALCGASVNGSLQGLANTLKLSNPSKLEMDFDGPITIEALDYNAKDVDLTWRVYQGLRDIYEKDGYTCTDDKGMLLKPITQLLSEASRGKGLLQELGIKQPRTKFDKDEWHKFFAVAMASTYGGRAEVRHRLDIAEGIHVDFKSQYTSAYLWLGLEKLLKAERISVVTDEDGTRSAANWLRSVTLDTLFDPSQGSNLAGYALIETDGAILPIRSEYQYFDHFLDQMEYNHQIGVNKVVSGPRCWYSFPDIVASIVKTKNCPRILKTMTFTAEGKQTGMMAKDLFGDKNYHINPNGDELVFKRLIDLRTVAKAGDNGGKEQGIKILASATSYGITIEFILEDRITDDLYENGTTHSRVITPVQTHINQQLYAFKKLSKSMLGEDNVEEVKVEKPGSYAAPWGPLIPAAGRLMLAIAEQLAADRGIPYGLCDTDSMYFVRPQGMERDTFRQGVKEIAGWFQTLMPYEDKSESLFNIEKHNYRLKRNEQGKVVRKDGKPEIINGEFEPLYLLAVSAKRYGQANFHECDDGVSVFKGKRGNWVLRKVSGHGLGHITAPKYNHKAVNRHGRTGLPEHDAAPQMYDDGKPVLNKKGEIVWQHGSICKGQNSRLFLDLWRAAFEEVCSYDGKPDPNNSIDVQRHGLFANADDRFEDWLNWKMNRLIETMPGLERPQMVQRSLSTANDMRTYNNLPNKAPGSFFNTFPQPMMLPMFDQITVADLIKLKEFKMSSLYAHGGKNIDVSTVGNAKRYGLTRRDNRQFPDEVFDDDWGIKFKTVAESLNKYFVHPEFKSQGKVGQVGYS